MRKSDTYGGNYLKATRNATIDMPGTPESAILTIKALESHEFDDGKKQRVLLFHEIEQKLGLNVTNWDAIARITGQDDDDNWLGAKIELFVIPEQKSPTGYAVRVKKPSGQPAAAPAPAAPAQNGSLTLSTNGAARLNAAIAKLATEGTVATIDECRTFLTEKFPAHATVLAGAPEQWPAEVAPQIKVWLEAAALPF